MYTISATDNAGAIINSMTHTVILSTTILLGVYSDETSDSICSGDVIYLFGESSMPTNYTLTAFAWNTGATTSGILSSPVISTASYSFSALYSSALSRTCIAIAVKTFYVKSCPISTSLNNFLFDKIVTVQNPISENLTIFGSSDIILEELILLNSVGQIVFTMNHPEINGEMSKV